jgi:epoxyqueuosine reductase
MSLEQETKDKALQLGFDAVGITDASPIGPEHVERFEVWLRSGHAGRMEYMQRNLDKRLDPGKLLDGAKSVVVVALSYKPREEKAEPASSTEPTGRVAQYAQYEDYHQFIKSLLRELADFIRSTQDTVQRFKVCVDSVPLGEKALAARAGLGFIGKHHLLIHPQWGPQILLGELITTTRLEPDEPGHGACRDCDRCIRACPTGALRPDGSLDARRCISYLTQYELLDQRARDIGDWLFGCDECLLACPFQQSAPACTNPHFRRHIEWAAPNLRELLELTPEAFRARFGDSPVCGPGFDVLKRNARLCMENLRGA